MAYDFPNRCERRELITECLIGADNICLGKDRTTLTVNNQATSHIETLDDGNLPLAAPLSDSDIPNLKFPAPFSTARVSKRLLH